MNASLHFVGTLFVFAKCKNRGGMTVNYQRPKGTVDLLPGESEKWQYIEEKARALFARYQFREIRTPIFEHFEVIARSVGDTTDIVSKEMYDFYDKKDRHITLRPEGTAPIARAFVENKLFGPEHPKPYKTFYIEPMFRYERPQAGRLRQFHQIGVEVFGSDNSAVDVETMAMALQFYQELGVKHLKLVINSLGDQESRQAYRQALLNYLVPQKEQLSADSKIRLERNPLRILDSKEKEDQPIIQAAPSILDYLNEESAKHFEEVCTMLDALGIDYEIDHRMVRGLDYYNHTIFEIMSEAPGFGGAITTVCAGGRYNGLVEELGGPATPAFGFGLGVERLLIVLEAENITLPIQKQLDVYVVGIGENTNVETLKLVETIRKAGFSADRDFLFRKPKAQFKTANKEQAHFVITIGEDELTNQKVKVKYMKTGQEYECSFAELYGDFTACYQQWREESEE